jgi:tight adherence protein C
MLLYFRSLTIGFFAIGTVLVALWWMALPIAAVPRHGYKGNQRRLARVESSVFALFEPLIRRTAAVCSLLGGEKWRRHWAMKLEQADGLMGLWVDEFAALSVLSALGLGTAVGIGCFLAGCSYQSVGLAVVLGALLPQIQLNETIRVRQKEIRRGLPSAIEIVALCMGAGLDFPASIRLVAEPHKPSKSALKRELRVILEQLELGCTRREALRTFAERVPTDAVRDFVNSVVQAEEKGNPLARVIQIQGRMLSQKRSVFAEEAAARAGVLMMLPMVLLMGCILLVLLGPFIVRGGGI